MPYSLHAHDTEDLRWYFAGGALVAIEESTFARQLERAALLGRSFRPCKRCGGSAKPWRNGTGFVPLDKTPYKKALRAFQRRECKRAGLVIAHGFSADAARAIGVEVITQRRADELFPELSPLLCRPCPSCEGVGIVDRALRRRGPITAFPTGSSKHGSEGPAVSLDESSLERHGRVSRLLKAVRSRELLAPEVLRSYLEPGGSYRAVWVYTPAGRQILLDNPIRLHPEALFNNVAEQEQQSHDSARKALLDSAQREAIDLVKVAGRAWNRVVERELLNDALRGTYGADVRAAAAGALASGGKLTRAERNDIVGLVRDRQAERGRMQRARDAADRKGRR